MNVLFLSEVFYPHGAGGELATYLYAKLLSKENVSVRVVTNRFSEEPKKSQNDNFEIYRLPLFEKVVGVKYSVLRRLDLLFSVFMRRLIGWADVVYIPKCWYSAILLAKAYGKLVVTHLHGYIPICPLGVLYDLSKHMICHNNNFICSPKCIMAHEMSNAKSSKQTLTSALLNSTVGNYIGKLVALSDAIICVSEAQKKLIITQMPSVERKLHMIYNPLPAVPQFNGQSDDFGYFGGSSPLRGFNIVCQALQNVNPKINIHVTKLPNVSKDLANKLRQLGIIAHKELSRELYNSLYKLIQVVILPSIWPEPLPYVVSEALLSKRLVIASRVGGIPEQTEGLEGAFLFESRNSEQLADLIEYVRDLPKEVKAELGSKNRESILKKFDNKKISRNFINLLYKVSKLSSRVEVNPQIYDYKKNLLESLSPPLNV